MQVRYQQRQLHISADIDSPSHIIWAIITDTNLWPQWGPSVIAVRSEDRYIKPNGTGKVQTALGFWLPYTITKYTALEHWSWTVAGITATGHSISQRGDNRTRLTFSVPWWAPPYLLICMLAILRIKRLALAEDRDLS